MSPNIAVLSPAAEPSGADGPALAPRLTGLQGKTVGLISNGWRSIGISYGELRKLLEEEFEVTNVVEKHATVSGPVPAEDFEELAAQVDAVITGLAN